MNKPTEISKEEYHKNVVAAWGKARKLASKDKRICDPCYFYANSKTGRVCSYSLHQWPEYRKRAKKGVTHLVHFMDQDCNTACPKTKTECFAKVRDDKGGFKYYKHVHLVGRCHWKETT